MASQQQHYDLNIPLPTARRKHQAQMCQERLHQLGYHEISFCHTSFGRIKPERDDADKTLPWNQLLGTDVQDPSLSQFGRTNSLGMKVYRRLNIVIEEVSDVSHFFLPSPANNDMQQTSDQIIQNYDIVSLQPMNEPVMQSICEFLSQSGATESSKSFTNNVQIITLEYAVGSKGGYGLPYKLRKDYVFKVLEAGLTFELNYSAAMVDPKRRQGFLRTLVDFQSAFNGIQKKHILLNKHIHSHQYNQMKCKSDDFPLLLSSGSRQNYTKGTDEGIMALRSPNDIAFMINNLTGRNTGASSCGVDAIKKNSKRIVYIAEKVLVKAREDKMGMIMIGSRVENTKTKSAIVVASSKHNDRGEASEDEDGPLDSLRDWMTRGLAKRQKIENACNEGQQVAEENLKEKRSFASRIGRSLALSRDKDTNRKEPPTDTAPLKDGDDDLEDGYIAL